MHHGCLRRKARLVGLSIIALAICAIGAACAPAHPTAHVTPTPAGPWTTYQDRLYPFTAPIPPGWQANAYMNEYRPGDQCAHEVDFVPPVSQAAWTPAPPVPRAPELIRVVIPVKCANWTPADNTQLASHSQSINISGQPATLYDGQPDNSALVRLAIAQFGGHQFQFAFEYDDTASTPAAQAKDNLALYLRVLQGFVYGAK